ncbi:MAG: superoxide dismutase family protein [Humidesulfovibrio sp.]|jgi:Cu-Zn family superoxide dismutase|uniref:superoxide dismutase family protein n=1 Tax=Humidesulfovibrio sp. TaxID=2910988 RepID=UPI002734332A|nr:superoxide dismutase family protein [Humidesulfovibrio sp.]MDP2848163.1 superoxide dismutase family protein [Humidesulfovibrio sp.]
MLKRTLPLLLPLGLALFLSGCGLATHFGSPAGLQAALKPTKGNQASGLMTFRQQGNEVLIQGTFSGLTPGAHGLHIHEGGDCGGSAARNAGGHFNPTGARHGSPASPSHHLGDLPMLTAGQNGSARFQARMPGLTLDNAPTGIRGRTVIVTERPDDFTTQPTGNSGPAVSCGVIRPEP